jgi:hypothetical protein
MADLYTVRYLDSTCCFGTDSPGFVRMQTDSCKNVERLRYSAEVLEPDPVLTLYSKFW